MSTPPGKLPTGWKPENYAHKRERGSGNCPANQTWRIVQYRIRNGKPKARHLCVACGRMMTFDLPYSDTEAAQWPLYCDRSEENPQCERCGRFGTELHHWAPSAIFLDADTWPVSWLCTYCHDEWHGIMRIGGATTKREAA